MTSDFLSDQCGKRYMATWRGNVLLPFLVRNGVAELLAESSHGRCLPGTSQLTPPVPF